MDASIYALVLAPALTDLLPRSGIAVSQGTVGYYGSILQALFLLGWGLSMVWGPISDRIGRVRALMLTILCYSVFTFMCGLVNNIWQLAILRVFVGLGIGGEQPVGPRISRRNCPKSQRKIGAGLMHTGYYFGFFFASVANYFIGANFGWRWMFVFGGLPALLIGFIQFGVKESTKWKETLRRQGACAPDDARLVCQALLAEVRAPDDGDVGAVPDVDHRTVGGIDLRAHGDVTTGGQGWRERRRSRAAGVVRRDGARHRHDHRMRGRTVPRRTPRPAESRWPSTSSSWP